MGHAESKNNIRTKLCVFSLGLYQLQYLTSCVANVGARGMIVTIWSIIEF